MLRQKICWLTLFIMMLSLGWLVYSSRTGYWFAPDLNINVSVPLSYNLPSFVHAFAFTLLSIVILGLRRKIIFLSAGLWLGLELVFEIGQHPLLNSLWNNSVLPEQVKYYFLAGTFDINDVVAILVGIIAASGLVFSFLVKTTRGGFYE